MMVQDWTWLWLGLAVLSLILIWWLFKPPPPLIPAPVTKVTNLNNRQCQLSPVEVKSSVEPVLEPATSNQPVQAEAIELDEPNIYFDPVNQANLSNLYACRPHHSSSGRAEQICRTYLERRFGVIFPSCRPLFLRNPETKQTLELDCYNEELLLAVEYQGPQHYYWPNYLGSRQTVAEFVALLRRDKFKVAMCNHLGVHLIRVPYWVKNNDIPGYIEDRLPERLKLMPAAFPASPN